jgi:transposase-like protein
MSQRRRFTAAYKHRVLAEADACTEPGQLGALVRREGLYSSHLTTWRRPREQGVLEALTPTKRGRKARGLDPLAQRVAQLERDQARLSQQLTQAETIIEVSVAGLYCPLVTGNNAHTSSGMLTNRRQ